ncbi:hypothetical protein [Saccharothrix sp. Mg75]
MLRDIALTQVGVIQIDFEHVSAKVRNDGPSAKEGGRSPEWAYR